MTQVADPYGLVPCVGSLPVKSMYRGPLLLTGLAVDAQDAALGALVGGLGQEDVVAPNGGGGVPAVRERGLPAARSRIPPQIRGRSFSDEWPRPVGPRQPGQFSPRLFETRSRTKISEKYRVMVALEWSKPRRVATLRGAADWKSS